MCVGGVWWKHWPRRWWILLHEKEVKFKSVAHLSSKGKTSQHLRWEAWEGDAWNHAFQCLVIHTRHHSPINAEGSWCVLGGKWGQAPAEVWEERLKLSLHPHLFIHSTNTYRASAKILVLGAGVAALTKTNEVALAWNLLYSTRGGNVEIIQNTPPPRLVNKNIWVSDKCSDEDEHDNVQQVASELLKEVRKVPSTLVPF